MRKRATPKPIIPDITYPPLPSRRRQRKLIQRRQQRRRIAGWILTVLAALLMGICIRLFIFNFARVEGNSMSPTLQDGQYVLVDRLGLRLFPVRRQDIVVLNQKMAGHTLIKRVVGLGGTRYSG